jgi:hypothetical protein
MFFIASLNASMGAKERIYVSRALCFISKGICDERFQIMTAYVCVNVGGCEKIKV